MRFLGVLAVLIVLLLLERKFAVFFSKKPSKPVKDPFRYDYAALDSGGKVLEHSREMYGVKGILRQDRDKYLLVACAHYEKWIEISLLEDIVIDEVLFIQGEIYSSAFKDVEVFYSIHYPAESWERLLKVTLQPTSVPQRFKVLNVWARFLRIEFKSHYDEEYYCTLSQFSVFGSTVLQNLNEDYIAQSLEYRERLNSLDTFIAAGIEENEYSLKINEMKELEEREDVCVEQHFFNFSCGKVTEVRVYNEEHRQRVNVFSEMIKHMGKTDLKLEIIDRYIVWLVEMLKKNDKELAGLKKSLNRYEKTVSKLQSNLKNLTTQLQSFNEYLSYLNNVVLPNDSRIDSLAFWLIFLSFLYFLALLVICYKLKN